MDLCIEEPYLDIQRYSIFSFYIVAREYLFFKRIIDISEKKLLSYEYFSRYWNDPVSTSRDIKYLLVF